jgi:lambda family phage portal protein
LPDLIVGTGIQTLADPFEPWDDLSDITPDYLDERLAYALESDELFTEYWHSPKQVDVAGKLAGPDLLRLFVSELARTGACLAIRSYGGKGRFPLQYQIIERDQLDCTKDTMRAENGNRIVNGIELDRFNREVAFHIYDVHPDDAFTVARKSARVPAERVYHVYRSERPSQNIGVSWLHAIGQNEIDRDKFLAGELQKQEKHSRVVLVHKAKRPQLANLGLLDSTESVDEYGNSEVKLGGSPYAAVIGLDEEVELKESMAPAVGLDAFMKIVDRTTAAGAGVSYYTLTGDYASTNFSSTRAAKLDEDQHVLPIQAWLGRTLALPIRRDFNRLAVGVGALRTVTAAQFLANEQLYQRFDIMGPGRELLDPGAETDAAISRLRSSLSTLKIECAKRGLHWVRVLRQKSLENHVAKILGVVLDFSKGQGGQVTRSTSAADAGQANEQGVAT